MISLKARKKCHTCFAILHPQMKEGLTSLYASTFQQKVESCFLFPEGKYSGVPFIRFSYYTFFSFSSKSFLCFLMLKSFVYTMLVNSYYHLYLFFLKNSKFEIYLGIKNKYAVYSFFLFFSIIFS